MCDVVCALCAGDVEGGLLRLLDVLRGRRGHIEGYNRRVRVRESVCLINVRFD